MVTGNTVVGNGEAGFWVEAWADGGSPPAVRLVENNIFAGNARGLECTLYSGGVDGRLSHNAFWENAGGDYIDCPAGEADILADPLFENTGIGDYHLRSGSPCKDAGFNGAVALSTDIDGEKRIVAASIDIGADELADSDGDGMDDDWELSNGLDPLDPEDAALDPDEDGLTNLDEYLSRTDPHLEDTDEDGLLDGEEVLAHETDPLNPDTDGDGLLDGEELFDHGTDPLKPDTDEDGLTDGEEVLTYGTYPLNPDSDDDGLMDGAEVLTHNTDPLNPDTDGDGMPDGWEVANWLDPLLDDSLLDPDEDGLTNLEEFQLGTHPLRADTDADGLNDGQEVTDYFTNPLDWDSDNDAMTDGWEVFYGLNPLADDAAYDPDSDGIINIKELEILANPQDPDSPQQILYVDDDAVGDGDGSPEHPFRTIEQGLENAWGSTWIRVLPGTYRPADDLYVAFGWNGPLAVTGEAGPAETVIEQEDWRQIVLEAGALQGFTIRGGYGVGVYNGGFLVNNIITGTEHQQGVYYYVYSAGPEAPVSAAILNNMIVQNANDGLAGYVESYGSGSAVVAVVNNTIADNGGTGIYGCAYFVGLPPAGFLFNNIVTGNGSGIVYDPSCTPNMAGILSRNDVWNNTQDDYVGTLPGPDDISVDPLFVDAASGDYHLQPGSPCVDAGNNEAVVFTRRDIDGGVRVHDGDGDWIAVVDIGADETSEPCGDQDQDGYENADCGGLDCNDGDPAVYPAAPELCDGKDNNCDSEVDEDADADGLSACEGDCDNADPVTYPGAPELCDGKDNDCDDIIPEDEADADADGYRICGGDCDDQEPGDYPGAVELCDSRDNDCDVLIDEDEDGDGYDACEDCDNRDYGVHPGANEVCDERDNNCDDNTDEDFDGDTFDPCEGGDCDETNPAINPDATEICDGIDNNCNGQIDEELISTPENPQPADGAVNVNMWHDLTWDSLCADSFDLYLWESGTPKPETPTVENLYSAHYNLPQGLATATTYSWQVEAKKGAQTVSGPVWVFTTETIPDLIVESVEAPSSAYAGQEMEVSWTITNSGDGGTDVGIWYDRVYLCPSETFNPDLATHLGYIRNPSYLGPGESYLETHSFTLPDDMTGTYYVFIFTDCWNHLREFDENNNWGRSDPGTSVVLPPPPDLQVTDVTVPGHGWSGNTIEVRWTVTNEGTVPTRQTGWWDAVILEDGDGAETVLGTFWHSGALPASAGYSVIQQVSLPVGVYGTDFTIVICTDYGDLVNEQAYEDNNCTDPQPIEITITPPPDLDVTAFSVDSTEALSGRPVEFTWTVMNNGPGRTVEGTWTDAVYLSSDDVLDPGVDTRLLTANHFGDLDVGEAYTKSRSVNLPEGDSGSFYVFVVTDEGNNVFEHVWEDNNTRRLDELLVVSLSPWPDLQVSEVVPPASAGSGDRIDVRWTVTNAGMDVTRTSAWKDRVYLSDDEVLDPESDTVLGTFWHTGALGIGEQYTTSHQVTLSYDLAGPYYVIVCTDVEDKVYEHTDEENNCSHDIQAMEVFETPPPDLVMTDVEVPETGNSGQTIQLNWTVTNQGDGETRTDRWSDCLYLSDDEVLETGTDVLLGDFTHYGVLDAAEQYTREGNVVLPNGIQGLYYLFAEADCGNRVSEPDEENNRGHDLVPVDVTLTPWPDLVVATVDAPETGYSGQPISVQWEVANLGVAATPSGEWGDSVYLSRDPLLDSSDLYLGYKGHSGSLGSTESYLSTAVFNVPKYASGLYYLILLADSTDRVYEHTGQDNNTGHDAVPIEIVLPPPADIVVTDVVLPVSGVPGVEATLTWTVQNQGQFEAQGQWWDAVYLSLDEVWDLNDAKVGYALHDGAVPSDGTYTAELTAKLPGVKPGDYYAIVRADIRNNLREEDGEGNNTGVSTGTISMDAMELIPGVAHASEIGTGEVEYFKVVVPAGEDLLLTLDCDSDTASTELYARFGEMPDRVHFDYLYDAPFQPDQEISISDTYEGTYYVMVRGDFIPGGTVGYTIMAEVPEFEIRRVSPDRGGNNGGVTVEIMGSRFKEGVSAEMILPAGDPVIGGAVYWVDTMRIYATFDLEGMAPGPYTIRLNDPSGASCDSPEPFLVEEGDGGKLSLSILSPPSVRPGRDFPVWGEYRNSGDQDLLSPLIYITSPTEAPMRLFPDESLSTRPVQILGVSFDGPVGLLRPGTTQTYRLYSNSAGFTGTVMQFRVGSRLANDDLVEDWDAVEERVRPDGVEPGEWAAAWSAFRDRIGTTWGDYLGVLAEDSEMIKQSFGEIVYSVDTLFQYELDLLLSDLHSSETEEAAGLSGKGIQMPVKSGMAEQPIIKKRIRNIKGMGNAPN